MINTVNEKIIKDISMYLTANGITHIGYSGANNVLLSLLKRYGFDIQIGWKVIIDIVSNMSMTTFFIDTKLEDGREIRQLELNRDIMNIINIYSGGLINQFKYANFTAETSINLPVCDHNIDVHLIELFRPLTAADRDRLAMTICDTVISYTHSLESAVSKREFAAWSMIFLAYDVMVKCGIDVNIHFGNVNVNTYNGYFEEYMWLTMTNAMGQKITLDIVKHMQIRRIRGYYYYIDKYNSNYTPEAKKLHNIMLNHINWPSLADISNPFNIIGYDTIKTKIYVEAVLSAYPPVHINLICPAVVSYG